MIQVILVYCSSTNVVYVVIINIVTMKEEVKELEWLEELSSFDLVGDSKCESILELASTTK